MVRFVETTDIRRASPVTGDVSRLTAELKKFGERVTRAGNERVAQQQFAAGKQAFEAGKTPEFKKEGFFGGIAAKAYNKGLRSAYVASLDSDNRESVARIAAENSSSVKGFNDAVENYKLSVMNNVDPTARDAVGKSLDNLISSNRIKIQNREISETHQANNVETSNHVETAVNDALRFAREGDNQSSAEAALSAFTTIDERVEAGFINSAEAAAQKRDIERSMVEEGHRGDLLDTFENESPQAAFEKLDLLSQKVPKGFNPEEWDSFIAKNQTELNRKMARLERDTIESAKQFKKEQDFASIQNRLDGDDNQIIDPKVADEFYQQRVQPAIENLPPEQRQAVQANYMDRLKIVPNTIRRQLTNAANSNNPDLLAEAAQLVDRIDDIPGVVNQIPNTEQAYLLNVTQLMQNMEPTEAVDLARKATDPKDEARIKVAEANIKEAKKDTPGLFREKSADAFGKVFFDPLIDDVSGAQMAEEYGVLWENLVKSGYSESDAFDKADKFIKRNWGETSALGTTRVMKYPPEMYYSIDNDTTWIRKDLMSDIKDQVAGLNVKAEDVVLMSNDITARTATAGQPSYAVKVLIDGSFVNIGQWSPDMAKEVKRRKDQNVQESLKERQRLLNKRIGVEAAEASGLKAL